MEQLDKIDIIDSSLPKEQYESFTKNVLSWIIRLDKGGCAEINPDYKLILMNDQCKTLQFLRTISGWANVIDFECTGLKLSAISDDKRTYLKNLCNLDKNMYSMIYFYIRSNLSYKYFFAITGKKNTDLDACITKQSELFDTTNNIKKVLTDLEKKDNETVDYINKTLQTTSENFTATLNDKVKFVSDDLKNHVKTKNKELEVLTDGNIKITEKKIADVMSKIADNENKHAKNIETINNTIAGSHEKLEKKTNDFYLALTDTINENITKLKNDYTTSHADTTKNIATQIEHIFSTVNTAHSSMTDKINIIDKNSTTRDIAYAEELQKMKDHVTSTVQTEKENITTHITDNLNSSITKINTDISSLSITVDETTKKQNETFGSNHKLLSDKLSSVNAALSARIDKNQQDLMTLITDFKLSTETQLSKMNDTFNQKINEINSSLEDVIETLFPNGRDIRRLP